MRNATNDQTFSGVLLIGLALLFLTGYWWPGIMFVLGIAMLARTIRDGLPWSTNRNALVVLGIGGLFAVWDVFDSSLLGGGRLWPVILILAGVYLLFGQNIRSQMSGTPKRKNDDMI